MIKNGAQIVKNTNPNIYRKNAINGATKYLFQHFLSLMNFLNHGHSLIATAGNKTKITAKSKGENMTLRRNISIYAATLHTTLNDHPFPVI